jgi:hypothetical protein
MSPELMLLWGGPGTTAGARERRLRLAGDGSARVLNTRAGVGTVSAARSSAMGTP